MDVIAFIEKDLGRQAGRSRATRVAAAAAAFALPVALGLGLRDSLEGAWEARTFLPNLAGAAALFMVALLAFRPARRSALWGAAWAGLLLGLFLATERMFFPPGARTVYPSSEVFWRENARCFVKGGVTTTLVGLLLTAYAFAGGAWPSRGLRALLAGCAGVAGAVMLGFHCDSSSVGHEFGGHLSQAAVFALAVFALQEALFRAGLRRSFPELARRLKDFARIG